MADGVMERLYQVTAPHFCAGVIVIGHHIYETAPILKWAKGWPITALVVYCQRKHWHIERVEVKTHG